MIQWHKTSRDHLDTMPGQQFQHFLIYSSALKISGPVVVVYYDLNKVLKMAANAFELALEVEISHYALINPTNGELP